MKTPTTDIVLRGSPIIAPSLLAADFSYLREALKCIEESGAQWVHLDCMDGHFVPNISFGPPVISAIRPHSSLIFDLHLMISNPELHLQSCSDAGADNIIFHFEAQIHAHRLITRIREMGKSPGVSIVPSTPVSACIEILPIVDQVLVMSVNPGYGGQKFIESSVAKVCELAQERKQRGLSFFISVDGGVGIHNAARLRDAGADVFVAGTSFFAAKDKPYFVCQLKGEQRA